MLFYVYPLLLSIVLYGLIAKALLSKSRNKFPGGRDDQRSKAAIKTNQSRVQVSLHFLQDLLIWAIEGQYSSLYIHFPIQPSDP